jgi:NADH-quinone oxidoreductase E subunit
MSIAFSTATMAKFNELLPRYPQKRAALLPTLWLAQDEFGYLSPEALKYVGQLLELPPSYVLSTASFYTMYQLAPTGKHLIEVCRTLSCALGGAFEIIEHCEKRMGIKLGETTPDGRFTLRTQECLGSCGTAPMFQVNGRQYYEGLTTQKVDEILESLV